MPSNTNTAPFDHERYLLNQLELSSDPTDRWFIEQELEELRQDTIHHPTFKATLQIQNGIITDLESICLAMQNKAPVGDSTRVKDVTILDTLTDKITFT